MAGCGLTIVTQFHVMNDGPGHTKHWNKIFVPHIDSNARRYVIWTFLRKYPIYEIIKIPYVELP